MLSTIYLFTVLSFSILKRSSVFNFNNLSFILVHLGFWIVIATAIIGSSDMVWLKMPVFINQKTSYAFDEQNNAYKMPFVIELNDFQIDQYNPNLAIMRNIDHKLVIHKGERFITVDHNAHGIIDNWDITVETYFPVASKRINGAYVPDSTFGSVPAAYIKVHVLGNDSFSRAGWISSGSSINPRDILKLNNDISICMAMPKPREFISLIRVFENDSTYSCKKIMVNKPCRIKKWNIYQVGYDKNMGKWTDYTLLEVVYDPWLKVLYSGIILMITGIAVLLFRTSLKRINYTLK